MSLKVVAFDEDRNVWDKALAAFPARTQDVYFTSAYALLWQRNGDGRAMGALFTHGDSVVLYPFLFRDLDQVPHLGADWRGLHDITSPYGYGGPLIRREPGDEHVINLFRTAFSAWCRDNRVVSEFVRFHPLLDTHLGMEKALDVSQVNTTVWCRLDCSPAERLTRFTPATRRNVRKALGSGLSFQVESAGGGYAEFAALYRKTMERRGALPYYFFGDEYFAAARELLGPALTLLSIRLDGKMIAGALFMRSREYAHYHLGGSDPAHLGLRPNNLLFFEALQWACGQGCLAMHLGGGYVADDDLFRFKAGFSPLRGGFYVGKAIHLPHEYERAAAQRAVQTADDAGAYFPAYRAPFRAAAGVG